MRPSVYGGLHILSNRQGARRRQRPSDLRGVMVVLRRDLWILAGLRAGLVACWDRGSAGRICCHVFVGANCGGHIYRSCAYSEGVMNHLLLTLAIFQAASNLPQGWNDVHLVDWVAVSETDQRDALILARPSETFGKVWVRTESRRNGRTSFAGLTEVRCGTREYRPERGAWYDGPNLTGSVRSMVPTELWSFAAPGTTSAAIVDYACGLAVIVPGPPTAAPSR